MSRLRRASLPGLVLALLVPAVASAAPPGLRDAAGFDAAPVRLAAGPATTASTTTLRLTYYTACGENDSRFDHTELSWSPTRLTVTVLLRPYPADAFVNACAAPVTVDVPLGQPLGQRDVYDGAPVDPRLVAPSPWSPSTVKIPLLVQDRSTPFQPTATTRTIPLAVNASPCDAPPTFSRTSVSWSKTRVTITAHGVTNRPLGDAPCPTIFQIQPVTVKLTRPLGKRAVYDGSGKRPKKLYSAPRR